MLISHPIKAICISCLALASCALTYVAQAVSPNAIELTYFASQIQCNGDSELINVEVDVYESIPENIAVIVPGRQRAKTRANVS